MEFLYQRLQKTMDVLCHLLSTYSHLDRFDAARSVDAATIRFHAAGVRICIAEPKIVFDFDTEFKLIRSLQFRPEAKLWVTGMVWNRQTGKYQILRLASREGAADPYIMQPIMHFVQHAAMAMQYRPVDNNIWLRD